MKSEETRDLLCFHLARASHQLRRIRAPFMCEINQQKKFMDHKVMAGTLFVRIALIPAISKEAISFLDLRKGKTAV